MGRREPVGVRLAYDRGMTGPATPRDGWTHLDAPGAIDGLKAIGDLAAAVAGRSPLRMYVDQGTMADGTRPFPPQLEDVTPPRTINAETVAYVREHLGTDLFHDYGKYEMDDEHVTPYQGDSDDLVARLEWFKSQVQCVKPGRELIWSEFGDIVDFVKAVLDANESMRGTITEMLAKDKP